MLLLKRWVELRDLERGKERTGMVSISKVRSDEPFIATRKVKRSNIHGHKNILQRYESERFVPVPRSFNATCHLGHHEQ